MFRPCNIHDLDEQLHLKLLANKQVASCIDPVDTKAKWHGAGPGPIGIIGGKWVDGVILAPGFLISRKSKILALSYTWENTKLGAWAKQTDLRLLLSDAEDMRAWTVDLPASSSGNIILPANVSISANCQIVLQLKAGDRVGRLRAPPYIPHHSVTVRYSN